MSARLAICVPLYHWMPATFFGTFVQLEGWHNAVRIEVVKGVYTQDAMTMMVANLKKIKGWDRMVVMEQDTIPPHYALRRAAMHTQDIVGSMYFRHEEPFEAVCYVLGEDDRFHAIVPATVDEWSKKPALYRCGSVGLGFTSIARRVIDNWDPNIPMFNKDEKFQSHDMWFCYWAGKQGFEVYMDTQLQCHHLTEVPINIYHNQAAAPMAMKNQKVISVRM